MNTVPATTGIGGMEDAYDKNSIFLPILYIHLPIRLLIYRTKTGGSIMRTDILERKEDILKWIEEEQPKSYICQQLNCKPETLNSYLKKMGIEYAGQQAKKGQYKGGNEYKSSMYYIENNIPIHSHKLKEKLIRDGLKEEKCELCGIRTWYNKKIPLELHHKNNNHQDNSLDNLIILCPNCHAIQPGNSGANINKKQC